MPCFMPCFYVQETLWPTRTLHGIDEPGTAAMMYPDTSHSSGGSCLSADAPALGAAGVGHLLHW
jgi:hypothetical protein